MRRFEFLLIGSRRRLRQEFASISSEALARYHHEILAEMAAAEEDWRARGASPPTHFLRRLGYRRVLRAMEHAKVLREGAKGSRDVVRLARCRSVLGVANQFLPPGVREEVLDEWMDDVETALEEGLPIRRRVASIVRSLPLMAWRCRRRAQARRERS